MPPDTLSCLSLGASDGISVSEAVTKYAAANNVRIHIAAQYVPGDQVTMASALQLVNTSRTNIIVTAVHAKDAEKFFSAVHDASMDQAPYAFVATDSLDAALAGASDPAALARYMSGALQLRPQVSGTVATAALGRFAAEWALSDDNSRSGGMPAEFSTTATHFATTPPSIFAAYAYDAVWTAAIAIAADFDEAGGTQTSASDFSGANVYVRQPTHAHALRPASHSHAANGVETMT